MVYLSVKGTTFPDEFVMECAASTVISPEFAQTVCHTQNARHQVRLQLLSARELHDEAAGKPNAYTAEDLTAFQNLIDTLTARLKDKATPVAPEDFDRHAEELRDATARLYVSECTHTDGRDAAVARLYELHENPDIDENERLVVYHCRAILDPQWKAHELQREESAGLWFCGKLMDGPVSRYVGSNEKSRLTVKVHPRDGAAPSGEPRVSYDDQRALFERMRQRREEYKALEESELRDRVVAQARGRVTLGAPTDAVRVDHARLRPIHPQREEREPPLPRVPTTGRRGPTRMTSLKSASKLLRDAAAQLAVSRGLDEDALPSDEDALLLLAAAALKEIERHSVSQHEKAAAARSARQLLRPHLPRGAERKRDRPEEREEEEEEEEDKGELDLGQYAKADVFHGDAKKRAKFARLMGGAKGDGSQTHSHHHHNTFAADETTQRRITGELEDQFNAAVHRHGKKGLGA